MLLVVCLLCCYCVCICLCVCVFVPPMRKSSCADHCEHYQSINQEQKSSVQFSKIEKSLIFGNTYRANYLKEQLENWSEDVHLYIIPLLHLLTLCSILTWQSSMALLYLHHLWKNQLKCVPLSDIHLNNYEYTWILHKRLATALNT